MKDIFCTKCAKVTPHKGYVDHNDEFVYECEVIEKDEQGESILDRTGNPVSHSFVKFPKVQNIDELNQHISDHQEVNSQVAEKMQDTRKMQAILEESLKDGTTVTVTSQEAEQPQE